jgi:hypothetical protein
MRAGCASLKTLILLSRVDGDAPKTGVHAVFWMVRGLVGFLVSEAAHSSIHGAARTQKEPFCKSVSDHACFARSLTRKGKHFLWL